MSIKPTNIPKCHLRQSAGNISRHRKLGEVVEIIRTFALLNETQPMTFLINFRYDSWNRIQEMTYPDGEVVSYEYNRGGMLNKVFGSVTRNLWEMIEPIQVQGGLTEPDGMMGGGIAVPIDPPVGPIEPQTITYRYPYIDSIIYNVFELKDSVVYGNGTRVSYEYDSLQRLSHLRSYIASGTKMQDITYTYDSASNITHISNLAGSVSGLGGRYEGHYTYDNLYRLVAANGYWKNSRDSLPFSESMNYTANGRILKKTVNARILNGNHSTTKSSDFRYSYAGYGNQVSSIVDRTQPTITQSFRWYGNGNVRDWTLLSGIGIQWIRTHTWTEDNRLQTVADNNWFSYYQYDAGGERTYKLTWAGSTSNRSGDRSIYYTPDEATLYASPYLVVTPQGYTKHYYAESERITSQLGKGQFADVGTPVVSDSLVQVKLQAVMDNVEYPSTLTVPGSGVFAYLDTLTNQQNATSTLYFYHPDHLGSSSWITTTNGTVKQHLHYLPWGEDFVNQRSSHFDGVRYTFSAKEKDTETGYSYFGARYYSSDLSIWLSVDPMSDKYPSTSPYAYCRNKPIILVDPNGMFDSESRAIRIRNRAAKKYGEDRVSNVFNMTIDGGKANYSFSIYGEGKTKYSRGGGTNEQGGPIITCDKADKVVSSRKDFRDYNNNPRRSLDISLTPTAGAQYGAKVDIKGKKIGLMGNIASVDLTALSLEINNDGVSLENYLINQAYIQGNSGFALGPIGYNYYSETSLERTTYSNHSVSVAGFNVLNSNPRGNEISYSFSVAVLLGIRLDLKLK